MIINDITSPQNVWGAASRTLTNPSGVWADAARTLTADPSPFTEQSVNISLGAGLVLDLRPAAGKFAEWYGAFNPTQVIPGYYDGSAFAPDNNDGSHGWSRHGVATPARGFSVKNISAGALATNVAGFTRG